MSRIFSASLGTSEWRAGLADPYLHWRRGKSAWEMAVSWESRKNAPSGLPTEIELAFARNELFRNPTLLVGVVEHRVQLDTPKTPSQNDLWCMIRTDAGQVSVAVEAKAGEDFDRPLSTWLSSADDASGKERRLAFLCEVLGIQGRPSLDLRYQLFHRAASAVLEARRWGAERAVMLVQSFRESTSSWDDFAKFAVRLGVTAERGGLAGPADRCEPDLFLGWVDSPLASDSVAAAAV